MKGPTYIVTNQDQQFYHNMCFQLHRKNLKSIQPSSKNTYRIDQINHYLINLKGKLRTTRERARQSEILSSVKQSNKRLNEIYNKSVCITIATHIF